MNHPFSREGGGADEGRAAEDWEGLDGKRQPSPGSTLGYGGSLIHALTGGRKERATEKNSIFKPRERRRSWAPQEVANAIHLEIAR